MLQVGRSRDRFPVSPGNFSVTSEISICPGVDSTSKNEYQVLKADNLPLSCADCQEIWGLNLLEPSGPLQACNGTVFFNSIWLIIVVDEKYITHRMINFYISYIVAAPAGPNYEFSCFMLNIRYDMILYDIYICVYVH